MKKLLIIGIFLVLASFCSSRVALAQVGEFVSAEWMALPDNQRLAYVLGHMEALQLIMRRFNWELRSSERGGVTAGQINERLYRKLLTERELRRGPVSEVLYAVLDESVQITDRRGKVVPEWQRILTTSDCAEILQTYR